MRRQEELTELMDQPDVDPEELAHSLQCIRAVNRYLGGTSAVLGHLKGYAQTWRQGETISILDVATGSADIPESILQWARGAGHSLRIVGLDLHSTTLHIAREWAGRDGLRFVRGDALCLPVADGAFDYAICSMFLHHLSNADAEQVIRELLRVSRRGIIVNDLVRSLVSRVFVELLTLRAQPLERHDARVSVVKGWVKEEVLAWRQRLEAPWLKYKRHVCGRFTLAGQRGEMGAPKT